MISKFLFCSKRALDKKRIIPITNFLKCPISANPLQINKDGNLQMEYIIYKKINNVFILVEDKADIML